MIKMRVILAALFLLSPSVVEASDGPLSNLSFLIGEWTVEGKKGLTERCEWFTNQSHIVCTVRVNDTVTGVSVFSHEASTGRYAYYHYGKSGVVAAMDIFPGERSLVATAERKVGSDLVREEVRITPRGHGFDFLEVTSKNGGPWVTASAFRYISTSTPDPLDTGESLGRMR